MINMSKRKFLNSITLALAAILFSGLIVSAQTYSGEAFAGKLNTKIGAGLVSVSPSILDTGDLPAAGGDINLGPALTAAIPTSGSILSLTSAQSRTRSVAVPATTLSTAGVDSTSITFAGLGISAGVITSSATAACPNNVLTDSGSVANLVVGTQNLGVVTVPMTVTVDATVTGVPANISGVLKVNETITSPWSVTRNALHLIVTDSLTNTTLELIVASSRAGIDCGVSPVGLDIFGGRGTAIRISQNTLSGLVPVGFTSGDTGPLPTIGSALVNAQTAGTPVVLGGLINVGATTVTSTTAGGPPAGTPDQTDSTSTVEDLNITADVVGIATVLVHADAITSKTRCSIDALNTPTCEVIDVSQVAGLRVAVIPLVGSPIEVLNLPLLTTPGGISLTLPLSLGGITLAWNTTETIGAPAYWITRTGLRVGLNITGITATDVVIARSFSSVRPNLATSAASATLSGRVMDHNGRAISRASISAMDSQGNVRRATTNTFGYYAMKDLPAGEFYVVSASARGFTFSARTVSLNDSVSGFDLYPDSRQTVQVTRAPAPAKTELVTKQVAAATPIQRSPQRVTFISGSVFESELPSKEKMKILQ